MQEQQDANVCTAAAVATIYNSEIYNEIPSFIGKYNMIAYCSELIQKKHVFILHQIRPSNNSKMVQDVAIVTMAVQ